MPAAIARVSFPRCFLHDTEGDFGNVRSELGGLLGHGQRGALRSGGRAKICLWSRNTHPPVIESGGVAQRVAHPFDSVGRLVPESGFVCDTRVCTTGRDWRQLARPVAKRAETTKRFGIVLKLPRSGRNRTIYHGQTDPLPTALLSSMAPLPYALAHPSSARVLARSRCIHYRQSCSSRRCCCSR